MSVAAELEGLRSETRLLRDHVRSLARGPGSSATASSPRLAWWREDQPSWLLAVSALAGCAAGVAAALAAAPWAGTALAAGFGGALPLLVRAAGGFRRRR